MWRGYVPGFDAEDMFPVIGKPSFLSSEGEPTGTKEAESTGRWELVDVPSREPTIAPFNKNPCVSILVSSRQREPVRCLGWLVGRQSC